MMRRSALWLFMAVLMFAYGEVQAKPNQKNLDAALLKAVEDGKTEKVRSLLRQGASINAMNKDGDRPIIIAAYVNESPYQYGPPHSLSLFKLLLSYNPNVNVKNQAGVTALITAATTDSLAPVKLLMARGARVNEKDNAGQTALMRAAYSQVEGEPYSSPEIVKYLLAHGANVNAKDKNGNTALIYASQLEGEELEDSMAIIKMLLAKGADVNVRNKNGNTALKWAKVNNNAAIIRVLKRAGARA